MMINKYYWYINGSSELQAFIYIGITIDAHNLRVTVAYKMDTNV